jgi:hypothetical protein
MVRLGELMMILELHRQRLTITAIARRTGRDPKTVRKYIERGIEVPVYGPRSVGRPSKLAPFMGFLRERVVAFPDLGAASASACRKGCRIAAATVVCWLWHVRQGITEMSLAQLGNAQSWSEARRVSRLRSR